MVRVSKDYQIDIVKVVSEDRDILGGNIPFLVKISDGTTDAHISVLTDGLLTEDAVGHLVYHGRLFTASHLFSLVEDDDYAYLRIKTHEDYYAFMNFSVETEAKAYIYLYEGTTFSDGGIAVPIYNNNRTSSNTINCLIYHSPTVSDNGTLIRTALLGTAGKFVESSGSAINLYARKLNKNTEYLIAAQNKAGAAKDLAIRLHLYETDV